MLGLVGTGKPGGDDGGGVGHASSLLDAGDPRVGVLCPQGDLGLARLAVVLGAGGWSFKGLMDWEFIGLWFVEFLRINEE